MGGLSPDERHARIVLAEVAEPGEPRLATAVAEAGAAAVLAAVWDGTSGLPRQESWGRRLRTLVAEVTASSPRPRGGKTAGADPPWHALAERTTARLDGCGGRVVLPGDGEWPTQLHDLGVVVPLALFVRGEDLRSAVLRSVAVVGARAASPYGVAVATDLAADLADRGWGVVSGGAYGIDAAAHRGALAAGGITVAVLACGVDVSYPQGHQALFERLSAEGVLVSELPPGAHPTRARFLTRNRLIAALSRATLVVEAAHRSGSLNTAATARALGRPVLAVPGPVTSPMSAGVHHLMREHLETTRLVTGADEVVEELGPLGSFAPEVPRPSRPTDGLDAEALEVFESLPAGRPLAVARVAVAAGRTEEATSAVLHRLRLLGLAEQTDDGWRVRRARGTVAG
jgi:DNA processing protein